MDSELFPEIQVPENLKHLSYSSKLALNSCPRKYQLNKMLKKDETGTATFAYGKAVGAGAQTLILSGGDIDKAVWAAFMAWNIDLEDESEIKKKKTFWYALAAIDSVSQVVAENFPGFEIAGFLSPKDGSLVLASELSARIDIGEGFYYRAFIDLVLYSPQIREYVVIDVKTTGFNSVNEASYKNSVQCLSYSVILDAIAALRVPTQELRHSSYHVYYLVYSSTECKWTVFEFPKAYSLRAKFLLSLLQDVNAIKQYQFFADALGDGSYPMHGESCFNFFRPCEYFGVCELSNARFAGSLAKENEEEDGDFHFNFTFDELMEAQSKLTGG